MSAIAVRRLAACALLGFTAVLSAQPADPALPLPVWQGVAEPAGVDERGLWMRADEDERRLQSMPMVVRDPAINDHLRAILCRTVGADRCRDVRIYVVRSPLFNATMRPNGAMEVYTGLLFRVHSDAELASVLGHEFAHYEQRHTLAGFRNIRSSTDIMAFAALLGIPLALTTIGHIQNFNRDQERDADRLGQAFLRQAGFPAEAAARIWERLASEARATATARGYKPERLLRAGFFDSHPATLERASYLRAGAGADIRDKADAQGPDADGVESYRAAISAIWPTLLSDQLGINDFAGTDHILTGQLALGESHDLLAAKAELHRRRGHPRDVEAAIPLYRAALEKPGVRAETHRGLGLLLLKNGAVKEGQTHLSHYMHQAPAAPDAALIRSLLPAETP